MKLIDKQDHGEESIDDKMLPPFDSLSAFRNSI